MNKNNDFRKQESQYNETEFKQNRNVKDNIRDSVSGEIRQMVSRSAKNEKNSSKAIIIGAVAVGVLLVVALLIILAMKFKDPETAGDMPQLFRDTEQVNVPESKYSPEQIQELRDNGYTGDEIEQFELNDDNPDNLIAIARKNRELELKETYKYLIDGLKAKDLVEFIKNTYYVNPKASLPKLDKDVNGEYEEPVALSLTENVDYWKVPFHGNQAMLKIKLKSGEICFFQVPISRYMTLRDYGNIVVTYSKLEFGKQTIIQDIYENKTETEGLN